VPTLAEMLYDPSRFIVEHGRMLGPPKERPTVWERLQQPKIET